MRKIIAAVMAGLLVLTLGACGGDSPTKAKTKSSDSDSDSDSKSSSKSKSSSSKSSSSKDTGGTIEEFCAQISDSADVFSDLDNGLPSDDEIDRFIDTIRDLQDSAPDEIADDMKTFVEIEIAAASAAKAAANNSDAQESAANKVIDAASDEFIAAATKVDQFAADKCGVGISGEPASDSFSDFSDFSDSFSDFEFSS